MMGGVSLSRRIVNYAAMASAGVVAQRVLTMDDTVDRMNHEIADVMIELIKKSPEVTEQAMDAIIIARNLERVGDHASNIAEDVIFWVRGADVRHHFGGESIR
jgi:phosphate transport system protein